MDPVRDFFGSGEGWALGSTTEKTMKKSAKLGKGFRPKARVAGSRGWIAMGTLAAYAVMGGTKSALAYVEKTGGSRGESASEASLPLKPCNIAAVEPGAVVAEDEEDAG